MCRFYKKFFKVRLKNELSLYYTKQTTHTIFINLIISLKKRIIILHNSSEVARTCKNLTVLSFQNVYKKVYKKTF